MKLTDKEQSDLLAKLSDKDWRLNNLYLILDEGGKTIPLKMRDEQKRFVDERRYRNFVPKARKLGLSTIIVIDNGDECVFNSNTRSGIIDLTRIDAHDKLSIFKFAWDNGIYHRDPAIAYLWRQIHKANPLTSDASGKLEWKNGSSYTGGTSYTGKTPQRLHVSEYGPISAASAAKATKIKRGSINAVPPDGIIDIETTMEGGQFGECYLLFQMAMENIGKENTMLDWQMQFYSWVNHPSYILPGAKPQREDTKKYFAKIKADHGLDVPLDRQAWYEKKKREQGEDMFQQFPTVVEDCDRQIIPGQIFPEMKTVRSQGRVREFNQEVGHPRFTCWDLGSSDNMAGWEVQPAGKDHNFLAWCAGEGAGAAGVADVIRRWAGERGPFAGHLVPHDANIHDKGSGLTFVDQMVECGIPREMITVVPRIPDMWVGVGEVRKVLNNVYFHTRCDEPIVQITGAKLPSGVQRIEGYRKKIDNSTSIMRDIHVHDLCSHTADALRTYAEALSRDLVVANVKKRSMGEVEVVSGFRGL